MTDSYSIERIEGLSSSKLRQEFELFEGKLKGRQIDIERVTSEIKDLQERPEYCPKFRVFQYKEIEDDVAWVYSEVIFTSNRFLDSLEKFLRRKLVSIPAKGFDDAPDEYLHFFRTQFDLIPVDISRTTVSLSRSPNHRIEISRDKFKGVDFASSCTLKMIEPKVIHKKLGEIERMSNFTVTIKKVQSGTKTEFVEVFEFRRGNEYKTVDHFVFRRK